MNARPVAVAVLFAIPVLAAAGETKPPIAQFWMDVATSNMSVPGMGDMESGVGGMMMGGGFFGATKMGGGSPGKWLDTALYTRNKPSGTEGTHAIPPGMSMGPTLPLLPVERASSRGGEEREGTPEKPRGKLLFYWGCSETVRPGQPRVVDFSKAAPEEWGKFMAGRFAPDRGAKAVPGRSVWPNEQDRQRVPKDASLAGSHEVTGEGVPPGLKFSLGEPYNFMPKVNMNSMGDAKGPVTVGWQPVANAGGYFLTAMGARGQEEMIIWSSSDQPDPGWGLMDYLPPAQVKKLIGEKVVLAPSVNRCAIPAGIFGDSQGAMVRMIAYGPELNLAHPPRPADPKASWEPEWVARVRIKSTGMTMLGMEDRGMRGGPTGRGDSGTGGDAGGSGGGISPMNVIKGIFGR